MGGPQIVFEELLFSCNAQKKSRLTAIMPKAETVQGFVSTIVDKPQVFFTPNNAVADRALNMAKHFFAAGKR